MASGRRPLVSQNRGRRHHYFQYVWPSFFWNLLTNRKLQDIVGNTLWKFIPKEWRYWWMDSITIYDCYEDTTLELPTPYFHYVTIARDSMRDSMNSKMLSSIAEACNEHLMQHCFVHGVTQSSFINVAILKWR